MFGNNSTTENETFLVENDTFYDQEGSGDVFNDSRVRYSLIVAYSIVFVCCFFGNLTVITVICIHRRMRTATNFFLANLAFADICVGIFCVYQNLLLYLTNSWALGDFLCRMYHFVHGLSFTASILILTVISVERYVVIVHSLWGRRFITLKRLKIALALVWILSAIYNSPRLFVYGTVQVPSMTDADGTDTLCVLKRSDFNNKNYDLYNFVILFAIPVLIMIILYLIMGSKLWKSGQSFRVKRTREKSYGRKWSRTSSTKDICPSEAKVLRSNSEASKPASNTEEKYEHEPRRLGVHRPEEDDIEEDYLSGEDMADSNDEMNGKKVSRFGKLNWVKPWRFRRGFFSGRDRFRLSRESTEMNRPRSQSDIVRTRAEDGTVSNTRSKGKKRLRSSLSINSGKQSRGDWSAGTRVLRMRRRIIRLLVIIVVCFVVCNLPYHARKFWQNWSPSYNGTSATSVFITIATTLIFYMNSGINPFLYAFLSTNFRSCIADIFFCRKRRWNNHNISPVSTGRMGSSERSNRAGIKQNSV